MLDHKLKSQRQPVTEPRASAPPRHTEFRKKQPGKRAGALLQGRPAGSSRLRPGATQTLDEWPPPPQVRPSQSDCRDPLTHTGFLMRRVWGAQLGAREVVRGTQLRPPPSFFRERANKTTGNRERNHSLGHESRSHHLSYGRKQPLRNNQ